MRRHQYGWLSYPACLEDLAAIYELDGPAAT
jgi:hypothetical protein